MSYAKIYAGLSVLSFLLIYVAGSFEQLELNPLCWTEGARMLFIVAYVVISLANTLLSTMIEQELR